MNTDNNQPLELAENMKRHPYRIPSLKDFNLDGWNWRTDFMPDDLVRLHQYKQELFYHNIANGIRTNESLPSSIIYSQLMSEFDIDMERLELFLFAGSQIAYDRKLNAMTDDELREHQELQQMFSEAFNDKEGLGGAIDGIVQRVKQQSHERKELENLWKESK